MNEITVSTEPVQNEHDRFLRMAVCQGACSHLQNHCLDMNST